MKGNAPFTCWSPSHVSQLSERPPLACLRGPAIRHLRDRVPQLELDRLLAALYGSKLTRDQERSLWLHRAVVAELVADPEEVLARARGNLQRLRTQHPDRGMTARWLGQWQEVFDTGVDEVA